MGNCMAYNEAQCADCVFNSTLGGCQSFTPVPDGAVDVCLGRQSCAQCYWMKMSGMWMCMDMNSGGGSDSGTGMSMPMMPMSFYQTTSVVILFKEWETKSTGAYILAMFLTMVFSAFVTIGRYYALSPQLELHKVLQVTLYFLVQCGVYSVMLITMTYNAGICLSVMVGITLGWAVWDHRISSKRALYTEVNTSCH